MSKRKPVMLIILDGFGIRKDKKYNGILNSNMKNYFSYWENYPHTKLNASGPLVGLPEGQIGSSEVGHLTMGSGRLIKQPIVRINEEIKSEKFLNHETLLNGIKHLKKFKGNVHLMGLLGPGGVHSSSKHLYAFLEFYDLHANEFPGKIFIHNFLDGRDTPQQSAIKYLDELDNKIQTLKHKDKFHIATICGRYYAMDRDKRWQRTKLAYDMIVHNEGNKVQNLKQEILKSYEHKVYDEFVKPAILFNKPMTDNDLCVFYNFRSDRPRQIISSFLNLINEFETKKIKNLKIQTLTEYSPEFKVDVLYPTLFPKQTLGETLSKHNLNQLRISESEKFPHVTYFFNGLKNDPFQNEDRIKVDSPKVATYDLRPEMSADIVTRKVIEEIKSNKHDFILLNFANPDMVGHTGNYKAVVTALKEIDSNLALIKTEIDKLNGTLMITADHGNCETMIDESGKPHTKHTYNIVPFILCNNKFKLKQNSEGLSLYNVAPTILELLKIKKPLQMKGESLITK